jgi:hypothetical protein
VNQYNDEGSTIDNDTGEVVAVEPTGGLQPVITAEINQAVATAHKYPRRPDKAIINEILGRATLDEEIAAECSYTLKRGNKNISGPSIRFAEIVRASYGNIRVASRFVALDMADPERAAVIVEAVALDLEMNQSEIIPNRRSIMTSGTNGRKPQIYSADMINMTVNAASSIARRNAILSVVPKVLWQTGYQRVLKVLMGNADTLIQRREKMIDAFSRFDVTPEMLFQAIGVGNVTEIKVDHMPTMIGMLTAIKEGEQVDFVLERRGMTETPKHEVVKNPLKDQPETKDTKTSIEKLASSDERKNPDDSYHGNTEAFAAADLVISRSGKVLKSLGDRRPEHIVDQRFEANDDIFTSFDEWTGICTSNQMTTEFGLKWLEPKASVNEDNSQRSQGGEPDGDEGPAEPASNAAPSTATQQPARENNAPSRPAASRGTEKPTFEGDEAYMSYMRDIFDRATSRSAINEPWGSTRDDRRELLSVDQIDALTKDRDAALKRFAKA